MIRRLGLGFLLFLLLTPHLLLAQSQIKSRRQQLEVLRRDKVSRLWPERQSQIATMVNKYVERGLFDEPGRGSNGFQPVVMGGMRSNNGFTYGIGYRRSDLFRDRLGFRVTARGTMQKAFMFDLHVDSPRLNSDRGFFDFYVKYENSPHMGYYGQGIDSSEDDETSYLLEDTELTFRGGYKFTDWLSLSGRVGGYFAHTGRGGTDPSIETVFPDLLQNTHFFVYGITGQVDYRDNRNAPRKGGNYYLRFTFYRDQEKETHSFGRIAAFAEQFLPYHNKSRVVALRVEGILAFPQFDHSVPFYLQPFLGGNNRMRGFEPYRFTDQTAFFAVAEHRWYVFSGLEAGLFVEAGKVAPRNGTLNFSNMKYDGGISLRFKIFNGFLMRVDNAFSNEGWRFIWTFDELFGRTKRW
jgi:outer membrane translocation and assembly module TamA